MFLHGFFGEEFGTLACPCRQNQIVRFPPIKGIFPDFFIPFLARSRCRLF